MRTSYDPQLRTLCQDTGLHALRRSGNDQPLVRLVLQGATGIAKDGRRVIVGG